MPRSLDRVVDQVIDLHWHDTAQCTAARVAITGGPYVRVVWQSWECAAIGLFCSVVAGAAILCVCLYWRATSVDRQCAWSWPPFLQKRHRCFTWLIDSCCYYKHWTGRETLPWLGREHSSQPGWHSFVTQTSVGVELCSHFCYFHANEEHIYELNTSPSVL
jgi:hypothetical protein